MTRNKAKPLPPSKRKSAELRTLLIGIQLANQANQNGCRYIIAPGQHLRLGVPHSTYRQPPLKLDRPRLRHYHHKLAVSVTAALIETKARSLRPQRPGTRIR
jgi:hypothetical protein